MKPNPLALLNHLTMPFKRFPSMCPRSCLHSTAPATHSGKDDAYHASLIGFHERHLTPSLASAAFTLSVGYPATGGGCLILQHARKFKFGTGERTRNAAP